MSNTYSVTACKQVAALKNGTGVRRRGHGDCVVEFGARPVVVSTVPGPGVDHVVTEAALEAILADNQLRHVRERSPGQAEGPRVPGNPAILEAAKAKREARAAARREAEAAEVAAAAAAVAKAAEEAEAKAQAEALAADAAAQAQAEADAAAAAELAAHVAAGGKVKTKTKGTPVIPGQDD